MHRILVLINRLADHGGAEVSTGAILDGLQGRDLTFDVVTLWEPADLQAQAGLLERGATFTHLPGRLPEKLRALSALVAERQPDLIHATLFHAELLAAAVGRRHDVPVLFSMVNTQYDTAAKAVAPSPRKLEVVRHLDQLIIGAGASHLHAISESVADHLRTELRVAPSRITVVPRGRSRQQLGRWSAERRSEVRTQLGLDDDVSLLLNIGRHERQKGQELLLRAVATLPTDRRAVTMIAGREGNETAHLQRMCTELGVSDRVEFLGARDDVPDLLCAADLLVCPSRFEGLGGALIEAMALELPVIAFDLPITREVLGDAATLVPAFDESALSTAIEAALEDPDAQTKLGAAALERFEERYAIEPTNAAMEDLYHRCAHPQDGAGRGPSATASGSKISIRPFADFLHDRRWDEMVHNSANPEYFQSSAWLEPWWETVAGRGDAVAIVATRDGVDIAALPLVELRQELPGGLGAALKTVTIAGSIAGSGDYFDIIHDGTATRSDAAAMVSHAMRWSRRRSLRFSSIAPGGLLDDALREVLTPTRTEPTSRSLIDSGAAWEDITKTWSKNRRKKIRQKRERFEALGGRFEWITDHNRIAELLPTIFDLHLARMVELDRPSAFIPDTTHRELHRRLVAAGPGTDPDGARCWVQLASIADEPVGILYGFAIAGNYYVYQSGWRAGEDLADLSMGLVQYAEGYHNVVEAGGHRYDMLRGTEEYKARFATVSVETNWYEQRRGPGRVAYGGLDLVRAGRDRLTSRPEESVPC